MSLRSYLFASCYTCFEVYDNYPSLLLPTDWHSESCRCTPWVQSATLRTHSARQSLHQVRSRGAHRYRAHRTGLANQIEYGLKKVYIDAVNLNNLVWHAKSFTQGLYQQHLAKRPSDTSGHQQDCAYRSWPSCCDCSGRPASSNHWLRPDDASH